MKYIIAMDSFKGCLTAQEVCSAARDGIMQIPGNKSVCLPLADGGEGTAAAMCAALDGVLRETPVIDPFGNKAVGYYGDITGKGITVIDTASASGLGLTAARSEGILEASTYGTGIQIKDMLDLGCRKISVGLGGSGTNDGGIGALSALGAVFKRKDGSVILRPSAKDLGDIYEIDLDSLDKRLTETELSLMYDVDIPLIGERGCSLNYSAQKGADAKTAQFLEESMRHYVEAAYRSFNVDAGKVNGAGAAGGLGFGLYLAGGKPVNGAVHILKCFDFDRLCSDADVVITGEGRTDFQTSHGKLPAAVAEAAKKHGLAVICVCGSAEISDNLYDVGIDGIFPIPSGPMTLSESMENAVSLITCTCRNIAGLIAALGKSPKK